MSDLLLKFGQRAVSLSGAADCVVEGGCGWFVLLYGDSMCQPHLHHNQPCRHEAEIARAAHITLCSSYEVMRTHSQISLSSSWESQHRIKKNLAIFCPPLLLEGYLAPISVSLLC